MTTPINTPITGQELAEWKDEANRIVVICPICSGDGLDWEDSSKDCYNCGGSGRLSAHSDDWKARTLRLISELEEHKRLLQKVHEWYWEQQAVPYVLEALIDEIDDTSPMLVKLAQALDADDRVGSANDSLRV